MCYVIDRPFEYRTSTKANKMVSICLVVQYIFRSNFGEAGSRFEIHRLGEYRSSGI